jgi:hypothetical protein
MARPATLRHVTASDIARRLVPRALWLAAAVLISLGGAGLVAAMDHVPGTPARAEITWAGDQEVRAALDAATVRLAAVDEGVALLGRSARLALAQVVARDLEGLPGTIAAGTSRLTQVESAMAGVRSAAASVPRIGPGDDLLVSGPLRQRHAYLVDATRLTDGLVDQWTFFTRRALDAARLAELLADHDEHAASAAVAGSEGQYETALQRVTDAELSLAGARALRDRFEDTTDVAVLDEWLERNGNYDVALRNLYEALLVSGGTFSREVRDAITAEQAARERLPGDTRALIVIMGGIAEGGLNQAVAAIEDVRAELDIALILQSGAETELP